ncbi:uncharacterized protein LAESUDRAFT_765450 [Laetiporus sulphureus 93-53]|uniref:Uncharacterized protein n=1 Tax=Laetiporus sulphureus 93-53 TaxID=1314785 RepID=A0A165ARA3_9APHY|nr:uncharacterized protein LAESUDRAFT_765450 [Laetiporus sulphureus 93-53]KZS99507.1 hypothetical protein LAESUDRAFT_765450 [Laetiporus sulphureus 93-53]
MGHKVKYHTVQERLTAKHEQQRAYAASQSPPDFPEQQDDVGLFEDVGLFDDPDSDVDKVVRALHATQFHLYVDAAYMQLDRRLKAPEMD